MKTAPKKSIAHLDLLNVEEAAEEDRKNSDTQGIRSPQRVEVFKGDAPAKEKAKLENWRITDNPLDEEIVPVDEFIGSQQSVNQAIDIFNHDEFN